MGAHEKLADMVEGPVFDPGDEGYDDERTGFQTAGAHRPSVIVGAVNADDVRVAVGYAAEHGLPVAVQNTGHGLPLGAVGGLLISTRRMTGLSIDPEAGTARIEAGVRWGQVIPEAAKHGLAPLSGSAPGVGAVSYTLGGGAGLLSRRFGFAADHVRSIDVVTADGRPRHVTPGDDLFWALLGGRANFGVVTSLEIGLVPVTHLYGGGLYFDTEHVADVLETWRTWSATVPDEMTSSIALMPVPDVPAFPEPLRGRHVAHVTIAYLGDDGDRLIAPLRAVGPRLIDTVGEMPYTESGTIYNEPSVPMAYRATNVAVGELDAETVHDLLGLVGPGAPDTAILSIRHLGGAMTREPSVPNAVGNRHAGYLIGLVSGLGPGSAGVEALHERVGDALEKKASGRLLNFLFGASATPEQVRASFEPETYRRLAELKAAYDPSNLFRLNHNIPPAA